MRTILLFTVACSLIFLAACQPVPHLRGNFVTFREIETIKVGEDSKEQVRKLLGAPTYIQMFGGENWFYIGEMTETTSFFRPDIVERKIAYVKFDLKGIVQEIDLQDVPQDYEVGFVEEETPTMGRDPALLREIFGTFGGNDEGKVRRGMVAG